MKKQLTYSPSQSPLTGRYVAHSNHPYRFKTYKFISTLKLLNAKSTINMISRMTIVFACLLVVSTIILPAVPVRAAQSTCTADIAPDNVVPGSTNSIIIGVRNLSDRPLAWVKILSPGSQYFSILSASSYQWQAVTTNDDAVFTDSTIRVNQAWNFSVDTLASNSVTSSPVNWVVQTTYDPSGADFRTCDGNLSVSISTQPSVINISDVAISNIGFDNVTVTWTTDTPSTSKIHYGFDTSYTENTPVMSDLVTSHTIKLIGLTSNTNYHYEIISTTPDGGNAVSGDSTFLTAVKQVDKVITTTIESKTPSNPVSFIIKNPSDTVPPTIVIVKQPAKVVPVIPAITGLAQDDIGVVRIEYSTDNGTNWSMVDSAPTIGSKSVIFSFTPLNLEDGSYEILARAIDVGGNITRTSVVSVVVDRLPPNVGGNVLTMGPQILQPDSDGVVHTLVGIDQKITLSAVGGPTSITLSLMNLAKPDLVKQSFILSRSPETGLWSGSVKFVAAGNFSLTAYAEDGAGQRTTRVLNIVSVAQEATVVKANSTETIDAQVSVYVLNPVFNQWQVWDGASYNQNNPQTTGKSGTYKLYLPSGTYYLEATAKGYHKLTTNSFVVDNATAVSSKLNMQSQGFKLGPITLPSWMDFSTKTFTATVAPTAIPDGVKNTLIGRSLPSFSLASTTNTIVKSIDLLGKPTVMTITATWLPDSVQLNDEMSQLQTNKDINAVLIGLQQNSGRVRAFTAIAGKQSSWLVDPDSTLTKQFTIGSLPVNYFVDRTGVIRNIVSGVLNKQEVLAYLKNL